MLEISGASTEALEISGAATEVIGADESPVAATPAAPPLDRKSVV